MAYKGKTRVPFQNGINDNAVNLYMYQDDRAHGDVFYVDSVTGTDAAGFGRTPQAPYASINYAVTQAQDGNDDLILVLPEHTETITAAGGCLVNKSVTIRGVTPGGTTGWNGGVGKKPTINYTTGIGASFDITAAGVVIDNLYFKPLGFAAITAAVNVKTAAADCAILNCDFELANATNQAVLGILTDATANRLKVYNNHFHGTNNAGTTAAIRIVGGSDIRIEQNRFQGAYSSGVGAIQGLTTDTVNCIVGYNQIQNLTAGCTKAMVFTAASTGQISDNNMQILSGTAPITGAAMAWVGANYYAPTIATAGTLI